jgi:uncharacterized protein (DUF1810 family)
VDDPFNLQRFVEAQDRVYAQVLRELGAGRKTSHWMWFVFPQIEGLGTSAMAQRFAISGRDEAEAYLAHLVLGPRLRKCTQLVLDVEGRTANQVFGSPDDLKFRSCMTLFALCAPDTLLFQAALDKYYDGERDSLTEARLGAGA